MQQYQQALDNPSSSDALANSPPPAYGQPKNRRQRRRHHDGTVNAVLLGDHLPSVRDKDTVAVAQPSMSSQETKRLAGDKQSILYNGECGQHRGDCDGQPVPSQERALSAAAVAAPIPADEHSNSVTTASPQTVSTDAQRATARGSGAAHCHGKSHRPHSHCRGAQKHHSAANGAGARDAVARARGPPPPSVPTTMCMNPYVRCVRLSNTVPDIKSLKELLAVQCNYADPAEADTPCLRPSDCLNSSASLPRNAAMARTHSTQTLRSPGSAALDKALASSNRAQRLESDLFGERQQQQQQQRSSSSAAEPSPLLSFTVDGVATPNTIATLSRHQQQLFAAAARTTAVSVREAQQENLLHEALPPRVTASAVDQHSVQTSAAATVTTLTTTTSGCGFLLEGGLEPVAGTEADADLYAVMEMQLPTSTVEIEAASEMQRRQQLESSTRTGSTNTTNCSSPAPETESVRVGDERLHCQHHRGASNQLQQHHHHHPRTNSSSMNSTGNTSYGGATMPCADVKQNKLNERIISPHSLSLPGGLPPPPLLEGTESTGLQANCFLVKVGEESQDPSGASASAPMPPDTTTTTRTAAATATSMMSSLAVTVVRPVAKIEESPYHYILRNFVGGSFLYYCSSESKQYFLRLCYRVVEQVTPILERETVSPAKGLFPSLLAPAFILGDVHGNFEDLAFFLQQIIPFHDFNLAPANLLCLGDYVDRGAFSLECVMLLFSLKIMNPDKLVLLRGNHEDRVVCGDLQTYGRSCFAAQCQTVFGYSKGMQLFKAVTTLFRYLPLACELIVPYAPNHSLGEGVVTGAAAHTRAAHNDPHHASHAFPAAAPSETGGTRAASSHQRGPLPHPMGSCRHDYPLEGGGLSYNASVHENLYVRQVCVPLNPMTPPTPPPAQSSQRSTTGKDDGRGPTSSPQRPGNAEKAEDPGEGSTSMSSSSCSTASSSPLSSTTLSYTASSMSSSGEESLTDGDDPQAHCGRRARHRPRRQPAGSRPPRWPGGGRAVHGGHTHEERILCTHGGIPRFFGPPLEEDSLAFLRSLRFPRLLTVFPCNRAAVADPECAPDYYNTHLLERLKRQYLPRPRCGCYCDGCVEAEHACASEDEEDTTNESVSAARMGRAGRHHPMRHAQSLGSTGAFEDGAGCGVHMGCAHRTLHPVKPVHTTKEDSSSCGRSSSSSRGDASSGREQEQAQHPQSQEKQQATPPVSLDEIIQRGWYVTFDLMWSDPTPTEPSPACDDARTGTSQAPTPILGRCGENHVCATNEWGFGINTRGNNVISYSAKAVDTFLSAYHYAILVRAHQEKAHGLRWSKNKRVLTIFSSSNYLGHGNGAGCVIVTTSGEVQMIEKLSDTHP